MNDLKTSIANTENQMASADDATDELADSTKNAGKEAESAGDGFTVFKGVLADFASSAIMGALDALKNMGMALIDVGKQAIMSYADYEQLAGGVETLFGDSADAVMDYAQNAYKTAGMSANDYMETVTSFSASLLQSLDGDTEKATKLADMAITDMSDNANKMGTDISSIQSAYQGFAKQNYTMLDNLKLGYGGTKSEMERLLKDADALSDSFNLQTDEAGNLVYSYADIVEAINIVQTEMGITGTTAEEASETISGSLASAQASWSNLLTGIADDNANFEELVGNFIDSVMTVADNLIPRIQQTITGIASMISQMLEVIVPQLVDLIPPLLETSLPVLLGAVQSLLSSVLSVLPEVITVLTDLISQVLTMLLDALPDILEAGIEIILALINGITEAIPDLLKMLPELITEIVMVLIENLPAIIETGVNLIDALIEGITEAIPLLIDQMPLIISSCVSAIVENLPKIIEMGVNLIVALMTGILNYMPQLVKMFPQIIASCAQAIASSMPQIIANGKNMITSLVNGAKSLYSKVTEVGKDIIDYITSSLSGLGNEMLEIGGNIIDGIIDGINNGSQALTNAVKGMSNKITKAVKDVLGIKSPSKVFKELGEFTAEGFGIGFTDEMKNVTSEMADAMPTSFDANMTASGLPADSLTSTGGIATTALVDGLVTALQGMRIEMGEDGFASFVVDTVASEIYQ